MGQELRLPRQGESSALPQCGAVTNNPTLCDGLGASHKRQERADPVFFNGTLLERNAQIVWRPAVAPREAETHNQGVWSAQAPKTPKTSGSQNRGYTAGRPTWSVAATVTLAVMEAEIWKALARGLGAGYKVVRFCESLGLLALGRLIGLVFNLEVNLCCGAVLGYLLAVQFHL